MAMKKKTCGKRKRAAKRPNRANGDIVLILVPDKSYADKARRGKPRRK